jgi:hypothetical protein
MTAEKSDLPGLLSQNLILLYQLPVEFTKATASLFLRMNSTLLSICISMVLDNKSAQDLND